MSEEFSSVRCPIPVVLSTLRVKLLLLILGKKSQDVKQPRMIKNGCIYGSNPALVYENCYLLTEQMALHSMELPCEVSGSKLNLSCRRLILWTVTLSGCDFLSPLSQKALGAPCRKLAIFPFGEQKQWRELKSQSLLPYWLTFRGLALWDNYSQTQQQTSTHILPTFITYLERLLLHISTEWEQWEHFQTSLRHFCQQRKSS